MIKLMIFSWFFFAPTWNTETWCFCYFYHKFPSSAVKKYITVPKSSLWPVIIIMYWQRPQHLNEYLIKTLQYWTYLQRRNPRTSGVTSVLCCQVKSPLSWVGWGLSAGGRPGPEAKSHFPLISLQSFPSWTLLDDVEEFMTYGIF